ncbi:unnamed protein product [Meganyctiphanes norvegica]|uniref:Uncharacterized protein n=1 Tax=Meganyctiphanes norvegica TaxID=48144 RepID=A0AAV2QET7_MEGNR
MRHFFQIVTATSILIVIILLQMLALSYPPSYHDSSKQQMSHRGHHQMSFTKDCNCKSLFTIGACGIDKLEDVMPFDTGWKTALSGLNAARKYANMEMMPHLATLARYLPQLFTLNVTLEDDDRFSLNLNTTPSRSMTKLPFVSCNIHQYTSDEVDRCTKEYKRLTGEPLRVAFVGDSRIRNTMQQMIRKLHAKVALKAGNEDIDMDLSTFLDTKVKLNLPIRGDAIELRLHWSAYLDEVRVVDQLDPRVAHQGARDLLEAWVYGNFTEKDGPPPHLIYMSNGLWETNMNDDDVAVEESMTTMKTMRPLLNKLSRMSQILWHMHGPFKDWIAIRNKPTYALDMMNRMSWKYLRDTNIWLWDTRTVLTLKERTECQALHEANLTRKVPWYWGCSDFQHAGMDVEDATGNMIWNLACNKILNFSPDKCCS